jgi:hypothetical protein
MIRRALMALAIVGAYLFFGALGIGVLVALYYDFAGR